jgi:hypothetical protein
MEWLNWTSPAGISIFIVSLTLAFYLFSRSVLTLSKAGKAGNEIELNK